MSTPNTSFKEPKPLAPFVAQSLLLRITMALYRGSKMRSWSKDFFTCGVWAVFLVYSLHSAFAQNIGS